MVTSKNRIYFNDLNEELKDDILDNVKREIKLELEDEVSDYKSFEEGMNDLYDLKDEIDIEEFIEEKALDKINREFHGMIQY